MNVWLICVIHHKSVCQPSFGRSMSCLFLSQSLQVYSHNRFSCFEQKKVNSPRICIIFFIFKGIFLSVILINWLQLWVEHSSKNFKYINLFNHITTSCNRGYYTILYNILPLFQMTNWGTKGFSNLPKSTQQGSGGARVFKEANKFWRSCSYSLCYSKS